MELNRTQKMAMEFNKKIREKMGERIDDFCIVDVIDDENHRAFSVEFIAYNYFPIRMNYEKGRFGCCILWGNKSIELVNSQKWWDEADFDIYFKEFKEELELRIPDKFLISRGWI
ncbi:MAG: hypothetical protein K0R15_2907 [Clostridiales bacterium]|jgi:hypothetical protein|nr:hypothetical protein [Clostridiales bacterium]